MRVVLTAWKAHGRYGYVNVELRNPEYESERTGVLTYGKGFEMGAFFTLKMCGMKSRYWSWLYQRRALSFLSLY
jgi:hypothetical protein